MRVQLPAVDGRERRRQQATLDDLGYAQFLGVDLSCLLRCVDLLGKASRAQGRRGQSGDFLEQCRLLSGDSRRGTRRQQGDYAPEFAKTDEGDQGERIKLGECG